MKNTIKILKENNKNIEFKFTSLNIKIGNKKYLICIDTDKGVCCLYEEIKLDNLKLIETCNNLSEDFVIIQRLIDSIKTNPKKYYPSGKNELSLILEDDSVYLGNIDVSKVIDMSYLFEASSRKDFSGIEYWDVSNVKDMSYMFQGAENFNQDISSWDVSSVVDMGRMFSYTKKFNQDLSKWDVSNVEDTDKMFEYSPLENNPPSWYINLRNKL